jgi:PAS domain S-box-containing protein
VLSDITERKRAEQALWESEEKYRDLVENIGDVIYALDEDGAATYVSPAIEESLGYTPSEIVGQSFARFLPPEDAQSAGENFQRLLSGESVGHTEYRAITKSGETRWLRVSSRPVFTDDHVSGVRGVFSDITERKRAEEDASYERDLMRTLLESVPDYVYFKDRNRRFVRASTSFCDLLKCSLEEIIGKRDEDLFPLDVAEETASDDRYVIETGTPLINREEGGESIGGEERWVLTTKLPWYDKDGNIVGLFGVSREITDRRRAEQEALRAKEAAETARREEQERRQEAERRRQIAESLADVMTVLNSNQTLDEVLDYIAMRTAELLGNQAVGIYRLEDDERLSIQAARGLLVAYATGREIPIGQAALRRAMATREAVPIPRLDRHPTGEGAPTGEALEEILARTWGDLYQALLAVPIIVGEELYGAIALYYSEPREFPEEEIELATVFGDQVALAIENARLRDQVSKAAAAAERERLARDLHDAVTQTLFSASLIAEALPRVWERDQDRAQEGLNELRSLTQGALAEMRTLLLELRPAGLTEKPLGELLGHLTQAMTGRSRVPMSLTVEGDSHLPDELQIALYRIAQEALNNIVRHAEASQVFVWLHCEPERLRLRIRDDGRGFDPEDTLPDQLGMGIMRERAKSVGATLKITSQPGQGTEVAVDWQEANGRPSDD